MVRRSLGAGFPDALKTLLTLDNAYAESKALVWLFAGTFAGWLVISMLLVSSLPFLCLLRDSTYTSLCSFFVSESSTRSNTPTCKSIANAGSLR